MRRSGILMSNMTAWLLVAFASVATAPADQTERVKPVPLGGRLEDQTGDVYYGVYVPTRFGGVLTIKTTEGNVEALGGPDGRARTNGEEVGMNQHGWYTFKVTGAGDKPYAVETTFTQVGQAARMPWNFYYWPTKADAVHEPWAGGNGRVDTSQVFGDDVLLRPYGSYVPPGEDIVRAGPNGLLETPPAPGDTSTWFPNLYDDLNWRGPDGTWYSTPSPLLKYDQLFGTSARNWEAANTQNQDIQRWPGHCLGGAIASIKLNEPTPAPGSGFTRDELKSLWAELGENFLNHRILDNANHIPAGPPRPGPDACDRFVPKFHAMLEQHIRGNQQALLANLRAFPPTGKSNEVWNHGVGKYTAKFHAVPGAGGRVVRLDVELVANSGANLNDGDNKPRVITYTYTLSYSPAGDVDETAAGQSLADWSAVGGEAMFAPLNMMEVGESRWVGHNPLVSEGNVRSLDLANGGANGPFVARTAPNFRPVGTYEAGRAPMIARNNAAQNSGGDPNLASRTPPPRRGLFGFFRGR